MFLPLDTFSENKPRSPLTKKILYLIVGSWSVLFLLTLPFSYEILPSFGKFFTEIMLPVYNWISVTFFGIDGTSFYSSSDSIIGYVQVGFLFIASILIGVILLKQKKFSLDTIILRLHQVLTYLLALFLLKYGMDKLLLHQFYPPEPNTLFTPVGMLSKDILFWSTMGSSDTYNIFMGLIEVVPGLLLFHRKTRMLGAFITMGVFTNVFFLNIGFDITVKLLSFMLLVSSMVVFAPYFTRFSHTFFGKESKKNELSLHYIDAKVWAGIKLIAILLITFETISPYISLNSAKIDTSTATGSYEVLAREGKSTIVDLAEIRRIHFHSKGYLIVEKLSGAMNDYPIQIDGRQHKIVLNRTSIYFKTTEKNTLFHWVEDQQEIRLITKKIDLDKLPLRQDTANWTVEGMLESSN